MQTIKNAPRPTLAEAKDQLAKLGWTPSNASWEDDEHVYAFSVESYPGTYGASAASVHWGNNGGWLTIPDGKPSGKRFQ